MGQIEIISTKTGATPVKKHTDISNAKYFVASTGDEPEQIFFHPLDAFVSGYTYMDAIGEDGMKIATFKCVDDEYTEDF